MIRQAINQINEEIKALQKERHNLQQNCKHSNKSIKAYSWRVGVTQDALMCNSCDIVIEIK